MKIIVNVKAGAKEEKIERISEVDYNISVKEKAEDNKANKKVINLLAKALGISYKKITIKNPTSKRKIIEVEKQ